MKSDYPRTGNYWAVSLVDKMGRFGRLAPGSNPGRPTINSILLQTFVNVSSFLNLFGRRALTGIPVTALDAASSAHLYASEDSANLIYSIWSVKHSYIYVLSIECHTLLYVTS